MNICIVSPYSWSFPGGVNNHIRYFYAEMVRRGHMVKVMAPGDNGLSGGRGGSKASGWGRQDQGSQVPDDDLMIMGRTVPVPANGAISRVSLWPGARGRVKKALHEDAFDILHIHEPLVPMVSLSALNQARCPTVGTFHAASDGGYLPYVLARTFLRRSFGRLDALIAVSAPARELADRYLPGDYLIIPNGVDTDRFRPGLPAPELLEGPGPTILFVGRYERRKGLEVLIRAFPRILSGLPEVRLIVAGGGNAEKKCRRLIGLEWSERILFAGYVPDEELPALYANADVFCAPSLGGESFGLVLLESMASGTPVVASNIPGYREVIDKTGGGLLSRPGDPDSLADSLGRILKDGEYRAELGSKGGKASAAYSWTKVSDSIEGVYEELVARPQV